MRTQPYDAPEKQMSAKKNGPITPPKKVMCPLFGHPFWFDYRSAFYFDLENLVLRARRRFIRLWRIPLARAQHSEDPRGGFLTLSGVQPDRMDIIDGIFYRLQCIKQTRIGHGQADVFSKQEQRVKILLGNIPGFVMI